MCRLVIFFSFRNCGVGVNLTLSLLLGVRSAVHSVLKRRGYNPADLDPWYFPSAEEYKSVSAPSFLGSHLLRRLS